ncbi:acyltransferase [Chloroflexia bacterium SDU3-3]|nr:acyltransferase [Chloroflexia bacterium SDU3-3]
MMSRPSGRCETTAAQPDAPCQHLAFLDGLRGIAALYVVIFHAYYFTREIDLGPAAEIATLWMNYGHYAVDVFIVLSGFCLMLPLARAGVDELPNGFGSYLYRRARRILPPYYAALAMSAALVYAGQAMQRHGQVGGGQINDALTPDIVLSHIFMVHNLDFTWAHRINTPLWSVATEWQIYFVFPLALLPLRRRLGSAATVGVALVVSLLPWLLLPEERSFYWAYPWFVALFAMGMLAARVVASGEAHPPLARWPRLFGWPVILLCYGLACLPCFPYDAPEWIADVLVGIGTTYLVIMCARRARRGDAGRRHLSMRLLESRWAVGLGGLSYSLYLIHNPIQQAIFRLASGRIASPHALLLLQIFVTTPLLLAAAYVFHRMFERPFLNHSPAQREVRPAMAATR